MQDPIAFLYFERLMAKRVLLVARWCSAFPLV